METSLSSIGTPAVISQPSTPTLCQLSRSGLEGLDGLHLRLTDLAAQEDAHARRRTRIISARQMEDKEVEQNREAEDEKYHASLASRAQEDRQRRKGRGAEDRKLERVERALYAQEDARLHALLYSILS